MSNNKKKSGNKNKLKRIVKEIKILNLLTIGASLLRAMKFLVKNSAKTNEKNDLVFGFLIIYILNH
jgi:hypothetical protein